MANPAQQSVLSRAFGRLSKWELLTVASLFVVSLAIRGFDLSQMAAYPDELTYGSRAIVIFGYGWQWPAKFMLDQPPLFMYVLGLVTAIFGGSLETLRAVSVLSGAGTVVVLYLVGRSMFGKTAGLFAGLILAFNGFHIEYSRLIYIESFAILLLSLTLLFFWESISRKSVKFGALTGFLLGMAVDTKYIALVFPVTIALMYLIHRRKFVEAFSRKQLLFLMAFAVLAFLPVGLDLAYANQNPFFWDLYGRFANKASVASAIGGVFAGGATAAGGRYTSLIAAFTHLSSQNPFQVFPLYGYELVAWWIIVAATLLYFGASFLIRRRFQDSILLLLFSGWLLFSILYPDKGYYFTLYLVPPIALMLGELIASSLKRVRPLFSKGNSVSLMTIAAFVMLVLALSAVATSAAATPFIYRSGFGDWDELVPIMTYVAQHEQPNATIVTNLSVAYYYGNVLGLQSQFASLQRPVLLAFLPPSQRILDLPLKGGFPFFWVISPTSIQQLHPQFVIMSKVYWDQMPIAFQQYVNENYREPLSSKLVLLFESNNSTAGQTPP